VSFRLLGDHVLAFELEFWVVTRGNCAFSARNMWTICGEFVVLVCILLVGNDDNKDRGELCILSAAPRWSSFLVALRIVPFE
jgi:hypothetical protein